MSKVEQKTLPILGAIAGDIIGSVYEWNRIKRKDFPLIRDDCFFTDDTVMTIAVAEWLTTSGELAAILQRWGNAYPNAGYGGFFRQWLRDPDPKPYNSYGNGSAMRVSAAGCLFDALEETLDAAKRSAEVTHNHPEGIKGAQATAAAIFLARTGKSKNEIREYVTNTFGYDLSRTVDKIRPGYGFDETCQSTVPEAVIAFLDSTDYEDAVRNAVSLGGDSDTLACITGGIAAAFYGQIPAEIPHEVHARLPGEMREVIRTIET